MVHYDIHGKLLDQDPTSKGNQIKLTLSYKNFANNILFSSFNTDKDISPQPSTNQNIEEMKEPLNEHLSAYHKRKIEQQRLEEETNNFKDFIETTIKQTSREPASLKIEEKVNYSNIKHIAIDILDKLQPEIKEQSEEMSTLAHKNSNS